MAYDLFDEHIDSATLAWCERQLVRFTYKPGWRFRIVTDARGILLDVQFDAEDAYKPGKKTQVGGRFPIYCVRDLGRHTSEEIRADLFARDMERIIWQAERHEAQEWLRRDGTIFNNPHK